MKEPLEYLGLTSDHLAIVTLLNDASKQGWELLAVRVTEHGYEAVLCRSLVGWNRP